MTSDLLGPFEAVRGLSCDVPLPRFVRVRQEFDPTGHYSRPDVFTVQVDRRRQEAAEFVD